MGLILDSSVLVAAERQGQNARQMLASIAGKIAETDIGVSVATLMELGHGAARADTPERKAKRQKFIEELVLAMPVHPVTGPIACAPDKSTARIRSEESAFLFQIFL